MIACVAVRLTAATKKGVGSMNEKLLRGYTKGYLFVMMVFLLCAQPVLSQTFDPPTTGEVIGGQIGNVFRAIQNAETALENLRIERAKQNERIREARYAYFSCLRGCDNPEEVATNFLNRLAEKDYHYFTMRATAEAASAIDQGLRLGTSGGAQSAVGRVSGLGGGPLDGGLIRGCSDDFKVWALGVYESVLEGNDFATAAGLEVNRATYKRYVRCRDRQEFARQTVEGSMCPKTSIENPRSEELTPGLINETLVAGCGEPADTGDIAFVHYTGWVFDQTAPDNRGQRVIATRRSGDPHEITLGTNQVFDYLEYGVRGMKIGEVRNLVAAPGLGYGERGFEPYNIPPNATLVLEVELVSLGSHPLEPAVTEQETDATYVSVDYDFEAQELSCRYSNGAIVKRQMRMGCPATLVGARHPYSGSLEKVRVKSHYYNESDSAFHCIYTDGVIRVIRRQCWAVWDEQAKQAVIAGDSTGSYLVREYADPDAGAPWFLNQQQDKADGTYHCLYTDGIVRVVRDKCRGGQWDKKAKEWADAPLYGLPRFVRDYEYGADPSSP